MNRLNTMFFWFISFKHPLGYVLQNRSLQKFWKTYKKTPLPEFLSDKAVHHQACNFIKKRLRLRCFTMNFAKLFSVLFLQNSSGVSHFNSTFLTLSLRKIYIYFFQGLLGLDIFKPLPVPCGS